MANPKTIVLPLAQQEYNRTDEAVTRRIIEQAVQDLAIELDHKFINGPLMFPVIDKWIDGDFVESQAFAYLAIRSYLKLPISFPKTTGVDKPCTGGVIVRN